MSENKDTIKKVKIVLLGEEGVGKTNILSQFIEHIFLDNSQPTLSASYRSKNLILDNETQIKIELWDTSGKEKLRALSKLFFKDSNAIILVYDKTRKKSFDELKNYWAKFVKESHVKKDEVIFALVENKSDLEKTEVDEETALKFAEELNAIFSRISAKNGIGIDDLFSQIAKKANEQNNYFY